MRNDHRCDCRDVGVQFLRATAISYVLIPPVAPFPEHVPFHARLQESWSRISTMEVCQDSPTMISVSLLLRCRKKVDLGVMKQI